MLHSDTRHGHDPEMDRELAFLSHGGKGAVAELFSKYRGRLQRMVEFRLDPRLRGRVDPGDVVQEAYIEIARRIEEYLSAPSVAFFFWARQLTWKTLLTIHRRHLGKKRNAGQDVSLHRCGHASGTSCSLAEQLAGRLTTPSQAAMRAEQLWHLRRVVDGLDARDREVITLRHFEHLSNSEVAKVLGISKTAASNRYVRALRRLRHTLDGMPELGADGTVNR